MKKPLLFLLFVIATDLAFFGYGVYAATTSITVNGSDTLTAICAKLTIPPVQPPAPSPAPTPSPTPPPVTSGSKSLRNVYLTFYAPQDNTPTGSTRIDLGGHVGTLGGDCTYNNPTTIAVGYSLAGGKETDDFAYGTKFYVPSLQCYFSALDQCGDTSSPQTQPCHQLHSSKADNNAPAGATLWLDAYEGPNNACENDLTDLYSIIENPVAGLPVKVGNICN